MPSRIADASLASEGERRIRWVARHSPVLTRLARERLADGALRGRRVAVVVHLEAKTAYLATLLAEAGADVVAAGSNPRSTQDAVCAALDARGVEVHAHHGATPEEFTADLLAVAETGPEIVIDDGAELTRRIAEHRPDLWGRLRGVTEETTTGVARLRALEAAGRLTFPAIAANDARCKYLFDNRYGSGQSAVNAVLDATNLLLAGKRVVVVGYGWVGKGIALRARGMGARVTVVEVDPFAALEAFHDGHEVAPLLEACATADVVFTASGVRGSLSPEGIDRLPDGALLANAGGIDDEFDVPALRARATGSRPAREHVEELELGDGRSVFVVGAGVCVNLSAGEGHPAEIMDLSFSIQALSARYLLQHAHELEPRVHRLPHAIDEQVARWKLEALGLAVDELTDAQRVFLAGWEAFGG